jgi:hypothetical protein
VDRRRLRERLGATHQGQADPQPAEELEALQEGHLFCLVSGNLDIAQMTQAFLDALPRIERATTEEPVGFWHVYRDGKIKRMWP